MKILPSLTIYLLFFMLAITNGIAGNGSVDTIPPEVRSDDTSYFQKNKLIFYGMASYYSDKFNGRRTASGEIFSQHKLTCASNKLPFGTRIRVTNLKNGRWVEVKVNDRLHPKMKRLVDLSKAGARKLGYLSRGLTRVKVEVLR